MFSPSQWFSILSLYQGHQEVLLKQIAGSYVLRVSDSIIVQWDQTISISNKLLLMLLVLGPYFEDHGLVSSVHPNLYADALRVGQGMAETLQKV